MFAWIIKNIATIGVSLLLILLVAMIIRKMIKDKRKGKSSCGGNCGCCPMSNACQNEPTEETLRLTLWLHGKFADSAEQSV